MVFTGAAYLYSGATGDVIYEIRGTQWDEHMGAELAGVGDVDHNGYDDFLMASINWDDSGYYIESAIHLISFMPLLIPDTYFVSASQGGTLILQMEFPLSAAGQEYRILVSETGNGLMNYGVKIPLTQDQRTVDSARGIYPFSNYTNLHGTLNASGVAQASIHFAPNSPPSLVGRTLWLAGVANPSGNLPEFSSIAVPLTFTL